MRKLTFGLVLALILALAAAFTGCEPNVPEDNGNNNEEITLMPDITEEVTEREEFRDVTDEETDMFGDGVFEGNEGNEGNVPGDNEDGNYDVTSAVEGETPAADFGDITLEDAILPLSVAGNNDNNSAESKDFYRFPNTKINWGLGKLVDEKNRPTDALKANNNYGKLGAAFIGESEHPTIYLTFDEGYENGYTVAILDQLKARNVRATFFVTYDYCESVPELVRRMIDEGHSVGNHSTSHPSFPDCSVEQIREEIGTLHDYIKEKFNYEMKLIRFPMGEFSERSLAVAQDMGYTSVFWSFAYSDWNVNKQPPPAESLEKIKKSTHPGGIYLLHAVSSVNAEILGDILDYWHSEGYRLGIIGEPEPENQPETSSSTENESGLIEV